ncbi:MAG: SGNH/GDSL hydrolase family protein [Propionibacteriaceae bacterium]|jgi:lysophospholipase L1-like esterase|nr:SGNH/GDSL hydrolase family protein [Propionibacteriaceae bacterium]
MASFLTGNERILFFGDSITETGRGWYDDAELGDGYVALVAAALTERFPDVVCLNRGVSGDGVFDLARRFERDCLALTPDVVSIMVGVNDVWLSLELGGGATPARYEVELDTMLRRLTAKGVRVVLLEPYLVPVDGYLEAWRPDLEARIAAVHRLAAKYHAVLVPTDAVMNAHPNTTEDGVHPTPLGHQLLAQNWLTTLL